MLIDNNEQNSTILIVIGIIFALSLPYLEKLGLGKLSGDIIFEKKSFKFYFPITHALSLALLSVLFYGCSKNEV